MIFCPLQFDLYSSFKNRMACFSRRATSNRWASAAEGPSLSSMILVSLLARTEKFILVNRYFQAAFSLGLGVRHFESVQVDPQSMLSALRVKLKCSNLLTCFGISVSDRRILCSRPTVGRHMSWDVAPWEPASQASSYWRAKNISVVSQSVTALVVAVSVTLYDFS